MPKRVMCIESPFIIQSCDVNRCSILALYPEGLLVVGGIYMFNNITFVKPDTMLTACDSIRLS